MNYQDLNASTIDRWVRAGFRLTDLYEDTNGAGRLHELNISSFLATCAVREA